jgi:1-acyl-sn-glycerol-3-phosphate acyltransferase
VGGGGHGGQRGGEVVQEQPIKDTFPGAQMTTRFSEDYSTSASAAKLRSRFPSLFFYPGMIRIVLDAAALARKGIYDNEQWVGSSRRIVGLIESVGVRMVIENVRVLERIASPCVFIGNHMSTLETFVLPCILQPYLPVTFVIKRSLIEYPVFKHVMISRDPIVVDRINPRDDFKQVMEGGEERIAKGTSVIVFPQSTRSESFDLKGFNSMGIKLAKRCGVPAVPIALKTNAWANGRLLKDFGRIDPSKTVHFKLGDQITIDGSGKEEQAMVVRFIQENLERWTREES